MDPGLAAAALAILPALGSLAAPAAAQALPPAAREPEARIHRSLGGRDLDGALNAPWLAAPR
jgi:hypothetical protein